LLPGAAGQLQPGCAHFSIFFSAIETPWLLFSVAEKHTPTPHRNQSHRDRPGFPSTKARRYNQPNFHPKEQAMGKINWNRVILGGLVAGVIINIFEYVLNGVILAKDMEAATSALGRQVGGSALAMFTVWGFLVGIFAVWLYAAIRPRY
jgi:hypothetical protein